MDKYEIALDITEHPENYTAERLKEILADKEVREIYNLICKTASAAEAGRRVDTDAEWERFAGAHGLVKKSRKKGLLLWPMSRAASIIAFVTTTFVAMAVGVAVTVAVTDKKAKEQNQEKTEIAQTAATPTTDSVTALTDSMRAATGPILFENETLSTIMDAVSKAYGVEVRFKNKETGELHLYYKLDTSLPIEEIVAQLTTFEQIKISLKDNTLTIE